MKKLPAELSEVRGGHQQAIDIAENIHRYVDQAADCLKATMVKEHGAHLRGGYLRQGDDYLEVVIRHAKAAREKLRDAYHNDAD